MRRTLISLLVVASAIVGVEQIGTEQVAEFLNEWGGLTTTFIVGGFGTAVFLSIRIFLNNLTVDKAVMYTEYVVDYFTKNDKQKKKLNRFIKVVSSLPVVKTAFQNNKQEVLRYLDLQEKTLQHNIIDLENKIEMGAMSDKQKTAALKLISEMKADLASRESINSEESNG